MLAIFCAEHNRRFALPAREPTSDFRPLPSGFDLPRCLSFRYQRVVAPDHTIAFAGDTLQLPSALSGRGYAGSPVELSHQLDGNLLIYRGPQLLLTIERPPEELVERKPATRKANPKTQMPRIYNLGGRPALSATT